MKGEGAALQEREKIEHVHLPSDLADHSILSEGSTDTKRKF